MNQKSGLPQIQRVKCMDCTEFACTRVCNYEALRISGKEYTVEELMEVIRRDRVFWQGNGGVTFGGGDPLVQWEFLAKVLEECKSTRSTRRLKRKDMLKRRFSCTCSLH